MREFEPRLTLHEPAAAYQPTSRRPYEVYGLTEDDLSFWRLGRERFEQILADEKTLIHDLQESVNSHGEFAFVTTSRPGDQGRVVMVFYGLGYHENRERYVLDEWYWYQGVPRPELLRKHIDREEVLERLAEREGRLRPQSGSNAQTDRGRLFEMLADLTDEDGALAEMEDLEDIESFGELLSNLAPELLRSSAPPSGDAETPEPRPLFSLGEVVATPGALAALVAAEQLPDEFLLRHQAGDWGELDEEDVERNRFSVEHGQTIASAYPLKSGGRIWIITEWDRSATTLLLPEEY